MRELTRHFFLRLFDTDLVTTPGQLQKLVIGIFAALCSLTMLAPISQFRKYAELPYRISEAQFLKIAEADRLAFLCFPMFLTAFVLVLQWRALFPSGRDHLILLPLPISRVTLFGAKFAALGLFTAIFAAAGGLFPTLILPVIQESRWSRVPVPQAIAAHAIASLAAVLFTFCALLALEGLLMNLLGRFHARLSLALHGAMLLVMLCAMPQLLSVAAMYRRGMLPDWFPPLWFAAIGESLSGGANTRLASTGWLATAIALTAAIILCIATYLRQIHQQMESRAPWLTVPSPARFFPGSQAFAVVSFIAKTLARSPQHKLLLLAYLGIAFAILANTYVLVFWFDPLHRSPSAVREGIVGFALSAPLVLSFFVISGLRVVFSIPCALEANWIFRLLEAPSTGRQWMQAVETAFHAAAAAPILITAAPLAWSALGWKAVPAHLAICILLSVILVELMLWEWRKVPFVCSYVPGQRNTATVFVAYWFFFVTFAYTSTEIEAWCLPQPGRVLICLGVLLGAAALLHAQRLQRRPASGLLFEDYLLDSFELLHLRDTA